MLFSIYNYTAFGMYANEDSLNKKTTTPSLRVISISTYAHHLRKKEKNTCNEYAARWLHSFVTLERRRLTHQIATVRPVRVVPLVRR